MNDLAKVGDVIEHGQDIPANVVRFQDVQASGDCLWVRTATDPLRYDYRWPGCPEDRGRRADDLDHVPVYFPLTVVEVDPEPQPAECPAHGAHPHGNNLCLDCSACRPVSDRLIEIHQSSQPAESGPLVLTLPVVPDGAVALRGNQSGRRWTPTPDGWMYRHGDVPWSLVTILIDEQPEGVTVEMAPPREPRTWPKLDAAPEIDDLPDVVDLIERDRSPLRFVRTTGLRGVHRYIEPGHPSTSLTLSELRTLGEVREVLDA